MIALYARRAVKNSCGPLRKKKSRKVLRLVYFAAIGVFRSILFLPFFSFCYRRCGSVKVKLVLNFSMQLNSVYTIQNYKVFIQYFQKSVKPADLILRRFSPLKIIIVKKFHFWRYARAYVRIWSLRPCG